MIFFARLCNDNGTIKAPADRMELSDNMIYAYFGDQLVAAVDVGIVLFAHICEGKINGKLGIEI